MMRRISVLTAALLLIVASVSLGQSYSVDPIHSTFLFKIRHVGAANFYARFNKASGLIKLDNGTLIDLNVVVDAESIDTHNKDRDEHLKSPDFFNTRDFPDISFKSTGVKKIDDTTYEAAGDLTLHGTTKPITVQLTQTGQGKNVQGKDVVGFETTFNIKRSEYGMSGYLNKGVGDDVTLIVSLESVRQ